MGADQSVDSIEEAVFLQELHDALLHLRDLPFRRTHPLTRRISPASPLSTSGLQMLLLDAVERLQPPFYVALDSPRWRRYRYLKLRYVEGAPLEQVVTELRISGRQARREHHAALQELAALLIQGMPASPGQRSADRDHGDAVVGQRPPAEPFASNWEPMSDLETELTQLESAQSIERVDLDAALEDALELVAPLASNRSVAIERAPCDPLTPVLATRTALRQILLNTLSFFISTEAVHHLRIDVTRSADGVELHFVSSDSLPPREGAPGDQTADFTPSLAAARHLAEGQGGSLQIDVRSSGDVRVHLLLPTAEATLTLVVDDNPSVAHLFQRFLRGTGYRLVQARNGFRALELAKVLHPDVIVLDLMMPVQDGWDLFRSLRRDPTTAMIPVVACSILPERELALALGAQGFLAKPVTPNTLLAALEPFRRRPPIDPPPDSDARQPADSLQDSSSPLRPIAHRSG